jgi:hypothetical protein
MTSDTNRSKREPSLPSSDKGGLGSVHDLKFLEMMETHGWHTKRPTQEMSSLPPQEGNSGRNFAKPRTRYIPDETDPRYEGDEYFGNGGGRGGGGSGGSSDGAKNMRFLLLFLLVIVLMVGIFFVIQKNTKGGMRVTETVLVDKAPPKDVSLSDEQKNPSQDSKVVSQQTQTPSTTVLIPPAQVLQQAVQQQTQTAESCITLNDVSPRSFLLETGACFTLVGATPHPFSVGSESPIVAVTGDDFKIEAIDGLSFCESRASSDRCGEWIRSHQILGGQDARYHKPRYWNIFFSYGPINIISRSAEQQKNQVTGSCIPLTDASARSFILNDEDCFSVGATSHPFMVGSGSPVTAITGADFRIRTSDGLSSCESRTSNDRCGEWLKSNQSLGGEDARFHKPRYWNEFEAFGPINILTATR